MKPRASRLTSAIVLAVALLSSLGVSAATLDGGSDADAMPTAMPTVIVQAPRPAMATVVVSAVKNSGDAIQPLLVFFVMVLFGGVVLHLRQNSRNIKA